MGGYQNTTDALRLKSEAVGKRGRLKSQFIGEEEFSPFLFDKGVVKQEFVDLDKPLGLEKTLDNAPNPEALRAGIFAFGGNRTNGVPQVAMLNTLFLREHNRLAGEIERNHPQWRDERIFQTARNTVIVLFIRIVVEEYINHISPLIRFRAAPSVAWDAAWNKPNWITTEFSVLYRWHPLIPDRVAWNGKDYVVAITFMNNQLLLDSGLRRAFTDMSGQRAGRPLIRRMVAVDAFSQALTNPLLSKYVYNEQTFSAPGWKAIHSTSALRDILNRNAGFDPHSDLHIGMTLPDWRPDS